MDNAKINVGSLFASVILILGILPATSFFGYTMPVQYILIPVFTFVFLLVLFNYIKTPKTAHYFILVWILIIIEVVFTGIFSPLLKLGHFNFPRDSIQYIARFVFFLAFVVIFYNSTVDIKKFMYRLIGVLLLGMFIGVLQFYGIGPFVELYSPTDGRLNYALAENYVRRRITGVGHHATANGGIAAFTMILLISVYIFHWKHFFLTSIGVVLVLFNIVTSQARMGYLTVAVSILIFYLLYIRIYKKGIKPTLLLTAVASVTVLVLRGLYLHGNEIVHKAVFRWQTLGAQVSEGGNRIAQVKFALEQLESPFDYIFGISRGVQTTVTDLLIEVEPVNVFVLYGGIGFLLQYSLIFALLIYFYKNIAIAKQEPILLAVIVASFISLLSYQFFSMAYYFYREMYIGLFPWILMGASMGALERYKKMKQLDPEYRLENQQHIKTRIKIVW